MLSPSKLAYIELRETDVLRSCLPFNGWERITEGQLPGDAKMLSVHHDPLKRVFLFLVESQTFDGVEPGAEPPRLEFTMMMQLLDPCSSCGKPIENGLCGDCVEALP